MTGQDPVLSWMVQGGALGILAYLVLWITRRLNGSIAELHRGIGELRGAVEEATRATRELAAAMSRDR